MVDIVKAALIVADQLVPAADSTANKKVRDVIGQKGDAAVMVVAVNKSIMAYVKGIVNQVAAILTGQGDIEGTGFVKDTHSLKNLKDLLDGLLNLLTFQQQDPVTVSPTPNVNDWVEVINILSNCRLQRLTINMHTTNETLEVKITANGKIFVLTGLAATHDTDYRIYLASTGNLWYSTTDRQEPFILESRPVKVEMRKTTSAGNGQLFAYATFATR